MFLGRVVAAGEPLWTDEDRAWAIALQLEEADECRGCGMPLAESTTADPVRPHYTAELVTCQACLIAAHRAKGELRPGVQVRVIDKRRRGDHGHGW